MWMFFLLCSYRKFIEANGFFLFEFQAKILLMKLSVIFLLLYTIFFSSGLYAQAQTHEKITQAVEQRNYALAADELENLRKSDVKIYEANNYDYLLARVAEKKAITPRRWRIIKLSLTEIRF